MCCNKKIKCHNSCKCNKCNSCNKNCEWREFPTCNHKNERDIINFLGEFVLDLLEDLDLPCGHPGLKASLRKLADGGRLPCGHPSLEELILIAILEDNKSLCKTCHKICCK
ncbi:MAG: hypothetical protein RR835_07080 [Peptostreptococcaceae bacterium]